ncbi:MAG: DNA pilot protein [Microvirus sp.]|nr:MAG: DNA pilot protein [Microvirus sp.]
MGLDLGLGSMIGAGLGYLGQQETNDKQMEMMQQQQQFQMNMSNTAYQRASQDMTKAGLNPMMMFGSGGAASTPSGASASPLVKSGLDADAIQKAVNTAVQANVGEAQVEKLRAETQNTEANTLTELRRPEYVSSQTRLTGRQSDTEKYRPAEVIARTDEARERAVTQRGQQDVLGKQAIILGNESITASNEAAANATARGIADRAAMYARRGTQVLKPFTDVLHSASSVMRGIGAKNYSPITHRNEYGDRYTTIHNGGP